MNTGWQSCELTLPIHIRPHPKSILFHPAIYLSVNSEYWFDFFYELNESLTKSTPYFSGQLFAIVLCLSCREKHLG